jgi:exodeoxyribonuclease VII large subunit
MNRHLDLCRKELRQIESSYVFQNPARLTEQAQLQLMHVTERLNQARPDNRLKQGFEKLQTLRSRLDYVTQQQLKQSISTFLNLSEKLNILNPLVMMGKGFSLVKKDSVIIKSVEQLSLHDAFTVTFQDGTVEADVTKLNKDVLPWKQN